MTRISYDVCYVYCEEYYLRIQNLSAQVSIIFLDVNLSRSKTTLNFF